MPPHPHRRQASPEGRRSKGGIISAAGNLVNRRPWRVIAVAVAFLVVAVVVGAPLSGQLKPGGFQDPGAEFVQVDERLEEVTGASSEASVIALVEPGAPIQSAEGRAAVTRVADTLAAEETVGGVVTAFSGGGEAFVSEDGASSYVVASFGPVSDAEAEEAALRIDEAFEGDETVTLGGVQITFEQAGSTIESDLQRAELIAFPIIFLLSLWLFRGFVAAALPLMVGITTILGAFLAIGAINQLTTVSLFALNLIIGLGLGLSIDYSLLMINRYREELAANGPGRTAIMRTFQTAGRSVLFSAITVGAALAGLMIFPQNFLWSMGMGGVVVSVIAALVALLLLPAVLMVLGARVNSLSPAAWRRSVERADELAESGFWYRLSRAVMRRPGLIAGATAALLIIVALPALRLNPATPDANILPTSASARQVSDALTADFPQQTSEAIIVTVDAPGGPGAQAQLSAYAAELERLEGAAVVLPPRNLGDGLWRIDVLPAGERLDVATKDLVETIRASDAPYPILVGGQTASFLDQRDSLVAHLPIAILIIAGVTIVALFMMTGSVLLPAKAVVMNLLTLAATMGLLVLIFQDGRFETLLSYQASGAIDLTQPILLGAIVFGLSTDYAVFLLSRIKEARDAGAADDEAVAIGLQRTGRIVTAAALLFAVAIGAFATSEITLIKELGVGTALAVLIDASIIRALLVPSLMALAGRWNWWAPGPLRRFHNRFGVSEGEAATS